ncbi:MAG: flagellar motor switch protein FliN [Lentisphaerae bacterium RIFOXYB12_FULL_65_16]|nr:MAG: flagellar motor switch protein FliN [Lentisphaerae bacterium RIFOXYA12_64_32]OGV88879.1 MAG: flagellar motor switch protein FliN [Lentisphaerae bacterium RIFOXYB12_FULL_65_16]
MEKQSANAAGSALSSDLAGDEIAEVQFGSIRESPSAAGKAGNGDRRNLDILYSIPLRVTAQIGETQLPLKELLALGPGAVVELERAAGESIDMLVNGVHVGRGEVVVVNEKFGLRITEIISPEERVRNL